jgi:hypothetical protein
VNVEDVELSVTQNAICRMSIFLELDLELHLALVDGLFADYSRGSHAGATPQPVRMPIRNLLQLDCSTGQLA